ncbi:MAG: 16S rRNA (cytosine(967)-C(5))-methyltransferase RsmB [Candidatus Kapabacteria bacterium]|nr:16S rRNA (cytosine(967)-C(5))-methyltransferase RsmB [Ignavibacteriota bacterium]MCW5885851.1 16S rRNA (cytosine(967)-C(5))-methyltransferase RsmB [Candidatus Kapabacteria bacterium]
MEKFSGSEEFIENSEYSPTVRQLAVRILNRYDRSDSYIDKLLSNELRQENIDHRDKALLNEIVNGVIRWRGKIDWILTGFYHGDYQKCLNLVKNSMRIALYQMLFLNRIPIPAAIYESVEIVKKIQGDKTAAIVNGVLRNIARNVENIRYPDRAEDEIYFFAVLYSHPKWMVKRWIERFGLQEAEKLMDYNNQRPYVPVRVVETNTDIDSIKEIFKTHNITYSESPFHKSTLLLESPRYDISSSEIFKSGKITIQDPSASIAARLADAKPGQSVIDLCAAPGGKSFLLAEMMENQGKVLAVDKHESKLRFINDGKVRLGLDIIETVTKDAETNKFDESPDIVFADVPCSGLGTIAKKPDIKWKKETEDLAKLIPHQRKILENASKIVRKGGVIIYSTCTIEPEENEDNINWFLNNHPEFSIDPAENYIHPALCKNGFYYSIPHITKMDGAFAVRLIKNS